MKVIKWLDEHFEEAILIVFLVGISVVELLQVICRNVDFIPSLTWAEELCRFLWIGTVFLSLPFCTRTETALRVTALIDILPWKLRNIVNVIVDVFTAAIMGVLSYYSVIVFNRIVASGELSPAMLMPMWILYAIVVVGFVLATLRSIQMFVIHIKTINVEPKGTTEAQAEFELGAEKRNAEKAAETSEGSAIAAAFTMNKKGD
jgi:C4-dicarboxylate transporter, DctQ subunit